MKRIVKDYAERRKEILGVTQRLIYAKGYEQMTIQEILDEIQISKGAFYHYFDSKQDLLEALIEHMQQEAEQFITPIVEDVELPALEKLQRLIDTSARWKTAHKEFILALMRVWYADDNAIVRQKVQSGLVKQTSPIFTTIIRQGIREGVFTTPFPDHMGEIILSVLQGLGDTFVDILIFSEPAHDDLNRIKTAVAAYTDALERILGSDSGSLQLLDAETIETWFSVQRNTPAQVFKE
jgi:TetR/AcrR family transcriptional repressor of nem operon